MTQPTTIILALLVLCSSCKRQQSNPHNSPPADFRPLIEAPATTAPASSLMPLTASAETLLVQIALADPAGARLVLFELPKDGSILPDTLFAVSKAALPMPFLYSNSQSRTDSSADRIIAQLFDRIDGAVYASPLSRVTPSRSTVVVSRKFLDAHKPLEISLASGSQPDSSILVRISHAKALRIERAWHIYSIAHKYNVILVHFQPLDTLNLLSLALVGPNSISFEDYPGHLDNPYSLWRVDDGGVIDPSAFDILAAFESTQSLYMVRSWAGPEGESIAFLESRGPVFEERINAYRYWVPE